MGSDMRHCVLTLVERKTGYAIIKKLRVRQMREVTRAATAPSAAIAESSRTITLDNGTEFHDYARLEQRFPLKIYFATPYRFWERNSNENFNGLLRHIGEGHLHECCEPSTLQRGPTNLNNRPRKRPGFSTAAELNHRK